MEKVYPGGQIVDRKILHGSNNGVRALQPVDVVKYDIYDGQTKEEHLDMVLVFTKQEDPNYPYATGSIEDMQSILDQIDPAVVSEVRQGCYVPLSNHVVVPDEVYKSIGSELPWITSVRFDTPNIKIGKYVDVLKVLSRFGK